MKQIINRIQTLTKKKLFGSRKIYEPYQSLSNADIFDIQKNTVFPQDLLTWYTEAGFGDINEEFSLRKEWISVIDRGELEGHVMFAQDGLGNFYSFSQENGEINYICRSEPIYGFLAKDFHSFLINFEKHDFDLYELIDTIKTTPYDWSV